MRRVHALHALGLHHEEVSPGCVSDDMLRRFMARHSSDDAIGPADEAPLADASLAAADAAGPIDDAPPAAAGLRTLSPSAGTRLSSGNVAPSTCPARFVTSSTSDIAGEQDKSNW